MYRELVLIACFGLGACQPKASPFTDPQYQAVDWEEKNRQLEAQLDPVKDAMLIQAIADSKKPRTYPRDPFYVSPIKDYAGESLRNADQIRLYQRAIRQVR